MIFLNLKEETRVRRTPHWAVLAIIVSLLVAAGAWVLMPRTAGSHTELVPLSRDERLVVIDVLDRLDAKQPHLKAKTETFRNHLSDDEAEVFMPREFFLWDTHAQEEAVLRSLGQPASADQAFRQKAE